MSPEAIPSVSSREETPALSSPTTSAPAETPALSPPASPSSPVEAVPVDSPAPPPLPASWRAAVAPFFASRGWAPFGFQEEAWARYAAGENGLVHAPTGLGKTYAAYLGAVAEAIVESGGASALDEAPPLRVLWLTPLRALANDTADALLRPIVDLGLPWTVELRHGDTTSHRKARQRERYPTVLVTTPESLTLLLTYPDTREKFAGLRLVVADEWHELLGSKRGVQVELALARLRRWQPRLRTWGLSATLGNLDEARQVLVGPAGQGALVRGDYAKQVVVETLVPAEIERFPWAGHLGLKQVEAVAQRIEQARATLVFTNTRSQTEAWFRSLLEARPAWAETLALHHGSLDRELRDRVEDGLAQGRLRAVVCTSSLDLGVDFTPVDQVIQIGSPKGIARLTQRAGRSGHQPGGVSRLVGVPTNALELVEFAAARAALGRGEIEARQPLRRPLDVLVQHLVTIGLGGGFVPDELLAEVRSTAAFAGLPDSDWQWALDFAAHGGRTLAAYPDYHRLSVLPDGTLGPPPEALARRHRLGIGTIVGDSEITVALGNGQVLGKMEESFLGKLRPGDVFAFAGRRLALVRLSGTTAKVRLAPAGGTGAVPVWGGGRSPLSTELAHAVLRTLEEAAPWARAADLDSTAVATATTEAPPELRAVAPILQLQAEWSRLPDRHTLLVESTAGRDGFYVFLYSFAGRLVHEGLATLVAWRLARLRPAQAIRVTQNDYGFSLHAPEPWPVDEATLRALLTTDRLLDDLLACLNTTELARRQFREIARVAGLVLEGFPGQRKTTRQLQASSGLLFDVFARYDPANLLLAQAQREILDRQLEFTRLAATLQRLAALPLALCPTARLTPLAFPLWADMLSSHVSAETRDQRLTRMLEQLEKAAG